MKARRLNVALEVEFDTTEVLSMTRLCVVAHIRSLWLNNYSTQYNYVICYSSFYL